MRAQQPYGGSMHRRKRKHASGSLTTKFGNHTLGGRTKTGKPAIRRYDKRAQKNAEKKGREKGSS